MISEEEFNSLGDLVEANIQGARPAEEVQTELFYAILNELRTTRRSIVELQEQFDKVTAYGNAMLTEVAR